MAEAQTDAQVLAAGHGEGWDQKLWSVGRNVGIFFAVQYAIKSFMGGSQNNAPPPVKQDAAGGSVTDTEWSAIPQAIYPLWETNATVDVTMYVSPSVAMPPFKSMPKGSLVVNEKGFSLERGKDTREISTSISVPKTVQDNGTLWAHIFVGQAGAELDPASNSYDPAKAYRVLRPLTQYLSRKKVRKVRNLLEAKNETEEAEEEVALSGPQIASYYHPNVSVSFIGDTGTVSFPQLHPAVRQFYPLDPSGARDSTGKNGYYYPVLYHNTFWQLRKDMTELNATIPTTELPLHIRVSTLRGWQFSLMASLDEGMKETAHKAAQGVTAPGGSDGSELEMVKQVLIDSNMYLLATTAIVSVFHMIFELLAFKSDVGHWRKKKDNVGVSVRTILANVFMQTVIFLYLMDNNENTSWMILFSQGMGIAIEAWKITKTVDVRVREPGPDSMFRGILPYVVVFEDKHKLSETEEKTEEYDRIAFKYMGIGAVPLLLAYAVYSLMYDTHRSWYSFIITTLVGSVYAYGFLMMIPSLYINYRLRSVAHMPGRAMMYKVLNTFIDDLFAFTIKMPFLHRLATLRDDVIFFVYLYQAYAYKVDPTRVNEFGQGGEEEEAEGKVAEKPLVAPAGADAGVGKKEIKEGVKKAEAKVDGAVASGKDKGSAKKRRG